MRVYTQAVSLFCLMDQVSVELSFMAKPDAFQWLGNYRKYVSDANTKIINDIHVLCYVYFYSLCDDDGWCCSVSFPFIFFVWYVTNHAISYTIIIT